MARTSRSRRRETLVWLLLLGMAATACQSLLAAAPTSEGEQLAAAFESLAEQIPAHLHDVDALAERLNYDVEAAIRHVTDDIVYEPYVGVLRGPAGTLSTAAGSVWDQAVLGAALVNAMAGEALLVEGTLAPGDVDRLLLQAFEPRPQFTAPIPQARMLAAVDGLLSAAARSRLEARLAAAERAQPDIDQRAQRIAATLTAALAPSDRALGSGGDALQALRRELAGRYVWIRWRDTPNDPWRDAHPAFGDGPPPEVTPARFLADNVPEGMLHQVEIALEIERQAGERRERVALMKPYRRPAANLAPVQVPIAIVPSGPFPQGGAPDFYLPMLHGALPTGAQVFTGEGLTANAGDAMAGPGVFAEVARKLGTGLDALTDGRGGQRLTGVILTVTHLAPGERRFVEERRLVDLRGASATPDARRILLDGVLDVGIGRENGAREQRSFFTAQAQALRMLSDLGAAVRAPAGPTVDAFSSGDLALPERSWPEMLLNGSALEPPPDAAPGVFRAGPLVTMRRVSQVPGQPLPRPLIDILHHPTVALRRAGGTAAWDPDGVMRQGARETVVEGLFVGRDVAEPWLTRGIDRLVADPAALDAWVADKSATPGVAERMAADLARAGVLLIPEQPADPRWWRVDPATGATLGMGEAGGVSLTEEIITEYVLTIYGGIMLINNIQSCADTYPDNARMRNCCITGQVMLYGVGMASGGAASEAFPKAGAAAGAYFATMVGYEAGQGVIGMGTDALADEVCKAITR
jgi:hypothetical protein